MDAFERIWNALQAQGRQPRLAGRDKLRSLCPAHPDRRSSFNATRTTVGAMVHCFSGCPRERVLEALGMKTADLFDNPTTLSSPAKREVVATYDYHNGAGEVVARKVRFGPVKGFGWRSPDPLRPGEWRTGIVGPQRPTLYRVHELIDERRVVVVEGEKAVDLLRTLNVAATCPPSGAATWRGEWTAMLWRGGAREVLVLADNDKAGRSHAERVAAPITAFAPVVADVCIEGCPLTIDSPDDERMVARVVRLDGLQPGGDVVDWLASGHDAVDLLAVASRTPLWSATLLDDEKLRREREQGRLRTRRCRELKRQRQSPAVRPARPEDVPAHPEVRH